MKKNLPTQDNVKWLMEQTLRNILSCVGGVYHTKYKLRLERKKKMEPITITLKRAVFIIKQHGNLDELEDFFKTLGRKKVYKTKDVKSWLGY